MLKTKPITLREALALFTKKAADGLYMPFDLQYRTFNKTNKRGGKLKTYKGARYLPDALKESNKNPNHFLNRTRNIELNTGEIRTIIIDFIIAINNQPVIF